MGESEVRKLHEAKTEKDETIEKLLTFVNKIVQSDLKESSKRQTPDEAVETLSSLATEAEVIYMKTRAQTQKTDLPYGWERASLSDGRFYFIDHINHSTSWTDPRELINESFNGSNTGVNGEEISLDSTTASIQQQHPTEYKVKMRLI